MKDYGYAQFTESEMYNIFENDNIDMDNIMVLTFCDYYFLNMSFALFPTLYDDVDVYVMVRTERNMEALTLLSAYNEKIESTDEFIGDETDLFIEQYFENVLCKFYFGM